MSALLNRIVACVSLLAGATACTVADSGPGLRAAAKSVVERRTTTAGGGGTSEVTVLFSGGSTRGAKGVAAIRLREAVDSTGQRLSVAPFGGRPRVFGLITPSQELTKSLVLQGISRDARSITFLEGEVDLSVPEGNADLLTFTNLPAQAGRPLDHPVLQRLGIRVTLLTPATFPSAHALLSFGSQITDFTTQAVWFIEDPSERLQSFTLIEASGKKADQIRPGSASDAKGRMIEPLNLTQPLGAAARLELKVFLPEATRTYPFRIENIALP